MWQRLDSNDTQSVTVAILAGLGFKNAVALLMRYGNDPSGWPTNVHVRSHKHWYRWIGIPGLTDEKLLARQRNVAYKLPSLEVAERAYRRRVAP